MKDLSFLLYMVGSSIYYQKEHLIATKDTADPQHEKYHPFALSGTSGGKIELLLDLLVYATAWQGKSHLGLIPGYGQYILNEHEVEGRSSQRRQKDKQCS